MNTQNKFNPVNLISFALLFICFFTSHDWNPWWTRGEPIRLDRFKLFGQANIYHLFSFLMFAILFLKKLLPGNDGTLLGKSSYIKNIFLLYFFIVTPLIYLCVYIKQIEVRDLGVAPIVMFFVYFVVTFYTQDIFVKGKNADYINKILLFFELAILTRCFMSIVKHLLGFTNKLQFTGKIMIASENDFSDFFILLIIIALVRLLFFKNESRTLKFLHYLSIITTSIVIVLTLRRYLWIELIIAYNVIFYYHFRFNRINLNKNIINISLIATLALSATIYVGFDKLAENYYLGRLLTSLSMVSSEFESEYGSDTGHIDEIKEGWYNVKNNFFLGISPFGNKLMVRDKTASWQRDSLTVHNAFLYNWLKFGLLGFILFTVFYLLSFRLAYYVFIKQKDCIGLILLTFILCQLFKCIIWPTIITNMNVTIVFIVLISMVLQIKEIETLKLINKYNASKQL